MLIWILGQTRSAISAIISQYFGAHRVKDVTTLPAQAIYFNIGLSLIILLSTFFAAEWIFKLFNAQDRILSFCVTYYRIRVWGFPLTLFVFAVMGIFRGLQNTFWPMVIALVGAGLNIVLDFILVYGIADILEPMNLEGAAWASLIAQSVMAIMAFVLLISKTEISLKLKFPFHAEFMRLVGMTFNLFIRTVALNLTLILAVREATALGDSYIGAHTIAINLWLFAAFFIDGYGAAGNIMGGRLLGAKDYEGLWKLVKKICLYGGMVSVVLLIFGFLLYQPLGRIFSSDLEVLDIFYSIFYLVILALPVNAIAFVLDGLFKGLGEMKFLRNVLLWATFVGFIPSLFLGKYLNLGLHGVWIAITVWMLIRGVALWWKFNQKFRPFVQKG